VRRFAEPGIVLEKYRIDHNEHRPQLTLGQRSPAALYAACQEHRNEKIPCNPGLSRRVVRKTGGGPSNLISDRLDRDGPRTEFNFELATVS